MKLINANIDYTSPSPNSLVLATTNSTLTNGKLVMGKGNALSMKKAHPETPTQFGNDITHMSTYGIVIYEKKDYTLGGFQTKTYWGNSSTIDLVNFSKIMLEGMCDLYDTIHLPMPGCNNGGLLIDDVLCVIHDLPDNVYLYHT